MELGELVFTLNVKTAALMQGVEASIGAMNRLVNTEDKAGASANVLEGRLALLSRQYRMQSSSVENATRAWEQAVAAHGQGSNAANKAESALMKELAALQRLAERMNAAKANIPFYGYHAEGGEYGSYAFASWAGKLHEAPLSHDGDLVLAVDENLKPVSAAANTLASWTSAAKGPPSSAPRWLP